jgi:hypothetical protein
MNPQMIHCLLIFGMASSMVRGVMARATRELKAWWVAL